MPRDVRSSGSAQSTPMHNDDGVSTCRMDAANDDGPETEGFEWRLSWYAVWTRSRHERTVERQLSSLGIETFLPSVNRWRRWKDRRKQVAFPLFPGYCFARFLLASRLRVLKCSGVVAIVSFGDRAIAIPDSEIEALQRLLDSGLPLDPCLPTKEGSMVEVVYGPLRGVIGRFVRGGRADRLLLSVDTISRSVSVEINSADVKLY